MGLDMYAYVAFKAGQRDEYYDGAEWDVEDKQFVNPRVKAPREIAYWRKHPDLHGYMHKLWESKGNEGSFNGDELELTYEDLEDLERAITHTQLPRTEGFFFGVSSIDRRDGDLAFVASAKAEIFLGFKVFYNSSW